MAAWDDEDEDSTPPTSPPPVVRRGKFDDEEDDNEVLDSWDAAEDSEVEREKAKKAAEAKAKADAEAKANHKSKSQRIEEKRMENMRRRQMEEATSSEDSEDEATRRARLRQSEKEADLRNADDLFSGGNLTRNRAANKPVTIADPNDAANTIDLSSLSIFNPITNDQFTKLRDTLAPLLAENSKKGPYTIFMQEFTKQITKDLPSEQIKKIASGLTALSNEKMKEEKAADKGGKKTKAAKTKTSLVASRDTAYKADTTSYDDFGE
ncbi:translation initiation factor eIF3 subunit [Aulographum hederae CBS 113979]|uniref:Eukaryotic translation initiation factor 3 subunit J n=1 Tax=Aulographum hederae CBS 113979 TaxID=1176131 RepID=A0A6G1H3W1_9PEZI|nr:translation initiation factor eIF3 subunit [Aulographum hederae CBS 113979]